MKIASHASHSRLRDLRQGSGPLYTGSTLIRILEDLNREHFSDQFQRQRC